MKKTDQHWLYQAAISCPHRIDSNTVQLDYDATQPGKNALDQLAKRLDAAAGGVFQAGRESGRNEVGLKLSEARAALWAIANTLDDHELRNYARQAYDATLVQSGDPV